MNDSAPAAMEGNTNKATNKKKRNQTSFTADSPYFTAYVDKEMKNLNVLTTTLRDISSKAKTFGKCGVLMSEATRRLSSACKLQQNGGDNGGSADETGLDGKEKDLFERRKNSVGSEMVDVLRVLGKVSFILFYFKKLNLVEF